MLKRSMIGTALLGVMLMAVSPALASAGNGQPGEAGANTAAIVAGEAASKKTASVNIASAPNNGSAAPASAEALAAQVAQLGASIGSTTRPRLKQFLENVRDQANASIGAPNFSSEDALNVSKSLQYAIKLAKDAEAANDETLWNDTPFIAYAVPPLSPELRKPDTLPEDGEVGDRLSIIAAQGEVEAASFILAPLENVGSVTFATYDLSGEGGTIPASAIDLRVVKNWYQGGTAWYSYFGDSSKSVLVPELLLHDETLIRVDDERQGNSLRVDYPEGSQYVDISSVSTAKFDYYSAPVEDSPSLLPIELKQGAAKQMWLTFKVPAGTAAGVYNGTIGITSDGAPAGRIKLQIRVLPFELPAPKTYYDLNKDFYVMLYHGSRLKEGLAATKGNTALVETRLLNEYRNMAEHNVLNIPGPLYSAADKNTFLRQLQLMQQAGLDLDPLFGVKQTYPTYSFYTQYINYMKAKQTYEANPTEANKQEMDKFYTNWRKGINDYLPTLDDAINVASQFLGHNRLYFDGWDEAGWDMLQFQQEIWSYLQDKGYKVFATGNQSHLNLNVKENYLNWVGEPTRERAAQWHAFGDDKMITNYAFPHTGPENPDLMRQRHGLWVYKANYDATYNYEYYGSPNNIWNDNSFNVFRSFSLVYPTKTDVIDTIAWEGVREGIDDIRYATKLKQVAADSLVSGRQDRIAAANQALAWLEEADERSTNQDLLRLEMIRHILHMLDLEHAQ